MQLKPDCIRDVLLYLEDNLTIELDNHNFSEITLEQLRTEPSLKEKYTEEDIWYTVYNLKEVRFIEGRINDAGSNKMMFCEIQNITWSGHDFLNTIRPTDIWNATKKSASKLGLVSMRALSSIAMSVANAIITNPTVIQDIVDKLH